MNKVFVVTMLNYYTTGYDKLLPDREILGVGATMAAALKMAEERLGRSNIISPVWYTSPTGQWAHTDTVSELWGAEIRAYDVVE